VICKYSFISLNGKLLFLLLLALIKSEVDNPLEIYVNLELHHVEKIRIFFLQCLIINNSLQS